jgi:hypothetical protein
MIRDIYIKGVASGGGGVTRSTATLMKTGQTTSYRTGDDGDLEAGRATDFFTLDTAPLHNDGSATLNTTTNRFTDTLGGQTYTDNIVLDWSTWNGSTLYGYKVTEYAVTSWNQAIDDTLATSIGIFTSGFRLTNVIELENICNWELTSQLNHTGSTSPFNTSGTWEAWTANTLKGTTANAISRSHVGTRLSRAKTGIAPTKAWAIRTFSLSTSNILS